MKKKYNCLLVTGGAGFIGSRLLKMLIEKNLADKILNLDALTYAADLKRLAEVENSDLYEFIHGDICDQELVDKLFNDYAIDGVIHLAAESHVDNSIKNPQAFVKTNIQGTQVLLDTAKRFWMNDADELFTQYSNARFLHVSTDEVYGSLGSEGYFTEETAYAPNSPYSASKASSDMMVRSYFKTFKLPVLISNCSNNYGPWQHNEKFIPTIIRKALKGDKIPIYGDGTNIRDWLFVDDHCHALIDILTKAKIGQKYNIGTDNEVSNIALARMICSILDDLKSRNSGNYSDLITMITDRKGHDYRYAIDYSKIKKDLGWKPRSVFKTSLVNSIKWYLEQYEEI